MARAGVVYTEKHCATCGAAFTVTPCHASKRFCSRACMDAAAPTKHHGLCYTLEHRVWRNLRDRCRNPKCRYYAGYGGRGIKVCDRWDKFENFYADMGPKPGPGYSIERIDNDGDYEPSNCKWGTKAEQSRNRRGVYTAQEDEVLRDAVEQRLPIDQICKQLGKSKNSITTRSRRIGLSFAYLRELKRLRAALAPQDQQPAVHTAEGPK